MVLIICTKNESNLTNKYWDMVPEGRTDGRNGRREGRTHGRRQNYIPPTSSGDKKCQPFARHVYLVYFRNMFLEKYV